MRSIARKIDNWIHKLWKHRTIKTKSNIVFQPEQIRNFPLILSITDPIYQTNWAHPSFQYSTPCPGDMISFEKNWQSFHKPVLVQGENILFACENTPLLFCTFRPFSAPSLFLSVTRRIWRWKENLEKVMSRERSHVFIVTRMYFPFGEVVES